MARQNKKPVPKQRSFWKRCVKYRSLILMSLPGLIAVFNFLLQFPMYGILIAFQDYNPVEGMFGHNNWVGFKYFKQIFTESLSVPTNPKYIIIGYLYIALELSRPRSIFALLMDQLTNAKF